MDSSLPGSSMHGILQARSGLPGSSAGDLPSPGTESMSLRSPALQVDSLPLSYGESPIWCIILIDF